MTADAFAPRRIARRLSRERGGNVRVAHVLAHPSAPSSTGNAPLDAFDASVVVKLCKVECRIRPTRRSPGPMPSACVLLKEQMKLLRGIYINNDIYYIYTHNIYIFIIRDKDN